MLKKEDLIALGLTEEQATKIIEDQKDYVPRSRLKEETDTVAAINKQLADRDADIKKLQGEAGKGTDLETKLTALQAQYKTDTDALGKQLADQKLDAALDAVLSKAKARDLTSVKAHIKRDALKIKDDGTVEGLDIDTLAKEKPYLFEIETKSDEGSGFAGGSGDTGKPAPQTMNDAIAAYYKNP
ncbi:MAG: phage scaffolding protein [Eubacteriales bacterium]